MREDPMKRRLFLVAGVAAFMPGVAAAQRGDTPMVGLLYLSTPPVDPAQRGSQIRNGLAALGWQEGRDIRYEHRFASGVARRLEPLAAELVAAGAKIIVAIGSEATLAARRATATIPIVMLSASNPADLGLVATLARPAGNVTGVATLMDAMVIKQLELLKEAVPRSRRVAILHGGLPYEQVLVVALAAAAARLNIAIVDHAIPHDADLGVLFRRLEADAFIVLPNPVLQDMRGRIADLAITHRLPGIGPWRVMADVGLLFSYAASVNEMQQRAAGYVDRILRGASPGAMPIEQPTKFELTVNRSTAWAIDLELPPAILARADEVIE
jgi:putative ABC transport system substrate-binding protein